MAAALLLGVISYTTSGTESPSRDEPGDRVVAEVPARPQGRVYPELMKLARRGVGDPLAVGRTDAPVVMVEYADFKCGYCGKFARDSEPALIKKYVGDGTLRIEWRNFPIFGNQSEAAARAAWAAGRQGRFWEFHAAAYAKGSKEKGFAVERLDQLAREAGVKDISRYRDDRESDAAEASVRKDLAEAYGLGATSTPSFVVNGRPIAGAQPLETFTRAIEAAKNDPLPKDVPKKDTPQKNQAPKGVPTTGIPTTGGPMTGVPTAGVSQKDTTKQDSKAGGRAGGKAGSRGDGTGDGKVHGTVHGTVSGKGDEGQDEGEGEGGKVDR
ncbi:DsbA family protein [Streptomyces sp. NPDC002018]|uniref:DsbA family protein n=1 Tax=Streptomyces sp. NPDC002018 TaxID=3364629 RepID=UPI0036927DA0